MHKTRRARINRYTEPLDRDHVIQVVLRFAQGAPVLGRPDGRPLTGEPARVVGAVVSLDGTFALVGNDARAEIEGWTAAEFRALQREVLEFLQGLVSQRSPAEELMPSRREYSAGALLPSIALALRLSAAAADSGDVLLALEGPARDVFWAQLLVGLQAAGLGRLRPCPGCGKLFVRVGKQTHCEPACRLRTYMRTYRSPAARKKRRLRRQQPRR